MSEIAYSTIKICFEFIPKSITKKMKCQIFGLKKGYTWKKCVNVEKKTDF